MLCSSGIGYPSAGELKGGGGGSMSKEDESEVSDSVLSARVLLNSLRGKSFRVVSSQRSNLSNLQIYLKKK